MAVAYLIYHQLSKLGENAWRQFKVEHIWITFVAGLLVFPNIYMVYLMWKATLRTASIEVEKTTKIQSFFAGILTGLVTPNMIGNFLGRMYYFRSQDRIAVTTLTLYTNLAQFVVTLLFGVISIFLFEELSLTVDFTVPQGVIFAVTAIILMLYFFAPWIVRSTGIDRLQEFSDFTQGRTSFKLEILGYAVLRFLIFSSQFAFFLYAFGVDLNWKLLLGIWQVYLITMLFPSLFLGKVGIKESVSIFILGAMGVNEYAALFASLALWLINTISPALVGLVICRKRAI